MSFDVPILLLAFRRKDTTKQVINSIRQVKPKRMFVACDGPREHKPGEEEECRSVRELIDREIDWPCEVQRLYREKNLGCREGVSTALDWFFDQVEAGIILEDDIVPDLSFFAYCSELLVRYQDDERLMAITGNNLTHQKPRTGASYCFSRYNHCWGWASWRRAWQHYDHEMIDWPSFRKQGWLQDIGGSDKGFVKYWQSCFDSVYQRKIDSWDYIWTFSCWRQGGLTALPEANLCRNIGFDNRATHTQSGTSPADRFGPLMLPLRHTEVILRDTKIDAEIHRQLFSPSLKRRILSKVKKLI
jgi:hypothetical protein